MADEWSTMVTLGKFPDYFNICFFNLALKAGVVGDLVTSPGNEFHNLAPEKDRLPLKISRFGLGTKRLFLDGLYGEGAGLNRSDRY